MIPRLTYGTLITTQKGEEEENGHTFTLIQPYISNCITSNPHALMLRQIQLILNVKRYHCKIMTERETLNNTSSVVTVDLNKKIEIAVHLLYLTSEKTYETIFFRVDKF